MKRNRGFTLMEMLIVVAIIAVLAAIAIPVFNGSLHKAKVAADMANVRAYYAELQIDYLTTGEFRDIGDEAKPQREIEFLDGTTVKLQAGQILAILYRKPDDKPNQRPNSEREPVGYQIVYYCDKGDHELRLLE